MNATRVSVTHNPAASRFEATVEGRLCVAQYRVYGKVMMLTHTGVPVALRGRGIAAELVRAALDHARARGLKVRPDCSYAEAYMQRHPETLDLLND
jgi:predicted GNAT family acetyltransferase